MTGNAVSVEGVLYDTMRQVQTQMQAVVDGQNRLMEANAGQREQLGSIRESLGRYDQELRDMKRDREAEAAKLTERLQSLDDKISNHGRIIWAICLIGAAATAVGIGVATDAVSRWMDKTTPAISAPHKPTEPKEATPHE